MLRELPLILILVGLAAYAVLAGADFGAGIWILLSPRRNQALRDHARHAMGPVWEANHVWLIFVFVVSWTAYPKAIASIASTLAVPLFVAAIGIILRGTAYAVRAQTEGGGVAARIERVLGLSSILTPFALGAAAGAIASGRVPVGNAAGDPITSWLNATGITIGALSVATSWYLASVYLAADATRGGLQALVGAFRTRALITGLIAGALALVALIVVQHDDARIWHGLTSGWGPLALTSSAAAGAATLVLVRGRRYGAARIAAAGAVAAVVAGWAIAQSPDLLPGLTIDHAAAGHSTLAALLAAVAGGALILAPSLVLLFGLTLGGRFDPGRAVATRASAALRPSPPTSAPLVAAGGCLIAGSMLTLLLDSTWGLALGVISLLTFIALAFPPLATPPESQSPAGSAEGR
jgi:cytochrome d ubiquinol oxidase subunit II